VFVDIARFRPRDFAFAAREGERFEPYGAPRYVAWIVPPAGRGGIRVVDLGEAAGIDALVAEYRDRIEAAKGPEDTIRKLGEAAAQAELAVVAAPLAKRTIEPLLAAAKEALGKDPEELVISPDGPLWLVPFAALVLADGRFAVEAVAIRHVTSGRDLVAKRAAPAADATSGLGRPLIMAAPNFDSPSTGKAAAAPAADRSLARPARPSRRLPPVKPLPGTLEEARSVADAVRQIATTPPEIVVADEATETRFKAARRPALAVLATHGFFLDKQEFDPDALAIQQAGAGRGLVDTQGDEVENPLTRCGLMFAGCNRAPAAGDGEDGVLTGLEILGCDLRGTRLVVLSACQTGLGKVESGEGVAGLRQAFQLAGAETVVSTLWSVPDKETAQLSNAMFTALAEGETAAQAVRRAQLAVIRSRTELLEASHPYYWAAFTTTGR
jgi:CHAT domain-containing protein